MCKVFFVYLMGSLCVLSAQTILTATDRFALVSQHYQMFQDYTANIHIVQEGEEMEGELFFHAPDKIRVNFSVPKDQVIVYDGNTILVYIPRYNVVLSDDIFSQSLPIGVNAVGLELMRQKYSIAYLAGPSPAPLEEESDEYVVGFRLTWKAQSEGFRELRVFIDPSTNYVRRIVGTTATYQIITMDFHDMKVNQNIPITLFDYDLPGSANLFENFLYQEVN